MNTATNCPECGQTYALTTTAAHPGRRVDQGRTAVVGVYAATGERVGTATAATSHWEAAGPSARPTIETTETHQVTTWDCLCGATVKVERLRRFLVPCRRDGGESGFCQVYRRKHATMPSYGKVVHSCPCCGHQGTHWVEYGQTAPCGTEPVTGH